MIDLRLKCACTNGEETLSVRERYEGEDIVDYMNFVQQMVGDWHSTRPCLRTNLEYLKMPVEDNSPIGVALR